MTAAQQTARRTGRTDVVVVGAGMAGLMAATELAAGGADVVLLEAAERVGGRVRTERAAFTAGQWVELGPEWVDSDHERLIELVTRFGLEFEETASPWGSARLHLDGRVVGDGDPRVRAARRAQQRVEDWLAAQVERLPDAADPPGHPDAAAIDARSLADLADEHDLDPLARLLQARGTQGLFACEPREISALFVVQQRKLWEAPGTAAYGSRRVLGGLELVMAALAEQLGDKAHLGAPVEAVAHGDDAVVVTTGRGRYEAAHVVLACPFPPLRRVRFEPALPPVLAAAVASLGYGTITKTALQFADRCWDDGSWTTTDGPAQRVYEPTVAQPGPAGILMAYIGGDGARALPRDEAERAEIVAAGVAEVQPCTAGRPSHRRSVAWHDEPYAGGAYAVYGPGQVTQFWRELRRPHGRVWLAGEHVATLTGYLEGAARSGADVAGDILRRLH